MKFYLIYKCIALIQFYLYDLSYLVELGAYDQYGCVGGVAGDGREPEVQAGVFKAHPHVPQ